MSAEHDEAPPSALWPLREVEVRGLFGRTSVPLPLEPSATILTGENGSGKSTVLQAVHCVGLGAWRRLAELPLDEISLAFADGTEIAASVGEDGVTLRTPGQDPWLARSAPTSPNHARRELANIRNRIRTTVDAEERRALETRYELIHRRFREWDELDDSDTPAWVIAGIDRFKTKLISARRLEHRLRPEGRQPGEEQPVSVVDRFAQELAGEMRDELSQYATESRRQEKVLPSQIVEAMQQSPQPDSESLAREVDGLRAAVRVLADSLTKVGLLQEEDPDQRFVDYPRDNASILLAIREVYRVTVDRLQRLTGLRSDLELFSDFLNERLTHKHIELNQRTGIDVVLEHGEGIKPSQLSSGEQQLLALAFELLFRTEPHSVVLLDEPELSLHVGWLQGLMSSFIDMGSSRKLQFVVATHSGNVLAGHQDLERSLDDIGTGAA